ncbi:MAG: hypothetical protein JXQ96_11360 [Cyclobacteriaceae bacterium]
MKRIFGILIAFTTVFMISCTQDSELNDLASIYVDDIDFAATSEAAFDDVEDATEEALGFDFLGGGRQGHPNFFGCADITKDFDAQTITIDFGDGCEGRNGRTRSGKIIITWSGERGAAGFTKTVTFENYVVDGVQIEGTRTSVNVSGSDANPKVHTVTLTGGMMTFEDGSVATREASHTKTYEETEEDKIKTKFGSASGINMDGLAYSKVVDEADPLLFKHSCKREKIFAPVSGVVTISVEGEEDKVVDYGDGECDNLAIVTQGDVVEEIEVNARKRRKGSQKRG